MIRPSSPHRLARFAVGVVAALTASSGLVAPVTGLTASRFHTAPIPLTNLAHIDWRVAGVVRHASVGSQGDSPAPGLLAVETIPRTVNDVESVVIRGSTRDTLIDALLVQPEVEYLVLTNDSNATALLRSFARHAQRVVISLPVGTTADVETYDDTGRLVGQTRAKASHVAVKVPAGGFAVVRS